MQSTVRRAEDRLGSLVVRWGRLYGLALMRGREQVDVQRAINELLMPTVVPDVAEPRFLLGVHSYHSEDRHAQLVVVADPAELRGARSYAATYALEVAKSLRLRKVYWELPFRGDFTEEHFGDFEVEARMAQRRFFEGEFWHIAVLALWTGLE